MDLCTFIVPLCKLTYDNVKKTLYKTDEKKRFYIVK